jgi:hypothetical protein
MKNVDKTKNFTTYGIDFVAWKPKNKNIVLVKPMHSYIEMHKTYFNIEGLISRATCLPEDKFNFEEGARIATTKILKRILKAINLEVNKEKKKIDQFKEFVEKRKA